MMKFFNTLGRSVEEFTPVNPAEIGLYTCGPTVYNFAHIGNFRAYLFEDILKRALEYNGYKVYGPDGCQMTSGSADIVLAEINKLDIFSDIKYTDYDAAVAEGRIEYISQDVIEEYYEYVLGCMLRKDIFTKKHKKRNF